MRTQTGDAWWDWLENRGVSAGWNEGLSLLFYQKDVEYILVVNDDCILPADFLGELLVTTSPS